MTSSIPPHDLDLLEDGDHLTRLVTDQFGAQVTACAWAGTTKSASATTPGSWKNPWTSVCPEPQPTRKSED